MGTGEDADPWARRAYEPQALRTGALRLIRPPGGSVTPNPKFRTHGADPTGLGRMHIRIMWKTLGKPQRPGPAPPPRPQRTASTSPAPGHSCS